MARLCRLSAFAFMGQEVHPKAFDRNDLVNGIAYCEGWIENGVTHDVIDGFCLADYIEWAKEHELYGSGNG